MVSKKQLIRFLATTPGAMRIGPIYASSGTVVPIGPNLRVLYSHPKILKLLSQMVAREAKALKVKVLAGMETAGIPLAAVASLHSGIPMVYLRKTAKRGWSKVGSTVVAGSYRRGSTAALVDDAMTLGVQKMDFIKRLQGELKVTAVLAIWDASYPARFKTGLNKRHVAVRSLVTKLEVMNYMLKHNLMHPDTYEVMLAQTNDPWHWQKNRAMRARFKAIQRRGTL